MTDEEIVALYWERNEDAIRQTQLKYGAYLTKIANSILTSREDCEECLNDTYLAAWNSMPENRPENLSTYLGKLVRQTAIDIYRKKNAQKRSASEYALSADELEEVIAGNTSPGEGLEAEELAAAVNRFLKTLPSKTYRLFLRRYYFFDSLKEAAANSGMSESKAKSLLFRTRKALRTYLEKEGFLP